MKGIHTTLALLVAGAVAAAAIAASASAATAAPSAGSGNIVRNCESHHHFLRSRTTISIRLIS